MSDILTAAFSALGGGLVVLFGLTQWFGGVLSGRIIEGVKAQHSIELSELKASLDVVSAQKIRNSDARFNLYRDVWTKLQDLCSSGDKLWIRASPFNLETFGNSLSAARSSLSNGRLILKEEHFQSLSELLGEFEQYSIGKSRLIDLRSKPEFQSAVDNFGEDDIRDQIRENHSTKDRYAATLEEVLTEFRVQLGLSA